MPTTCIPLLTPVIRKRIREEFPQLKDSDIPVASVPIQEMVGRIVQRTRRAPRRVRDVLYQIGAYVPALNATVPRRSAPFL